MKLKITENTAPLKQAFAISRGAKTEAKTVIVTLEKAGSIGRGECVPYARYGETVPSVKTAIDAQARAITQHEWAPDTPYLGLAGAAACAVDCAFWDLTAKMTAEPVWKLAGLPAPKPVETAVTVSLDTPEAMGRAAQKITGKLLKLKLGGSEDLARLEAVHRARPDARLILDGNEGLSPEAFETFVAQAAKLGAVLIEQPFAANNDDALLSLKSPVPICADESAHTSADIPALAKRYSAVNVKLDKTGGLTEAIAMVRAAKAHNMQVMIGCMVAGSLSMAPAVLLAGLADVVDLDGPIWLAEDITYGLTYQDGYVSPPISALWG